MKNAVFFKSGKGNSYLYSPYRNQLLLCHPLIEHLFSLDKKKSNLSHWLLSVRQNGSFTLDGIVFFPYNEAVYQLKKYHFLKRNGFFKPARTINIDGRLKVSDVRKNISSVKQVIFEVTEDCNLQCTYCTYSKYYINKNRHDRYLTFDMVKHSLAELIAKRTPSPDNHLILSFYGGEPLKNFDFIKEVVEFTQSYPRDQITFTYSLSSNGLLLKKYIDFLVKYNFDLSVSLDGDERANSFRITKNHRPSYGITTRNLDYIRNEYPDYFDKSVSFLTVLHSRNSFSSVYDFINKRYGKIPQMSDVNPINLNPLFEKEFKANIQSRPVAPVEEEAAVAKMEENHPKVRDLSKIFEYYSGFYYKNYLEMISSTHGKVKAKKFIPTATCTPFSIRSYFSADGTILPCEHISPFHGIGTFSPEKISLDPRGISKLYNRYYDKISKLCSKCYFIDNCQECMFNTGVEKERPSCFYYTTESGFREYMKKRYTSIEADYPFYRKTAQSIFYEG